jgi:hypothetical protein
MAGARLFLGRRNDPNIVGEIARDRLKQPKATRVHPIVVGKQDPHG